MSQPDHKVKSRTIKHIEQQAQKGDLLAIHTLYDNFSTGKYLENSDPEKAAHYLTLLDKSLANASVTLQSLQLTEFRRFKNLKVDFAPNMTVIIGNNGTGKTTIIDAIAKSLSWFTNNLIRKGVNGKYINELDIHVDCKQFSTIASQFKLAKKTTVAVNITKPVAGYSGNATSQREQARQLGDVYRLVVQKNQHIMLPLFACYTVKRSYTELPAHLKEKPLQIHRDNRFDTYNNSLDASAHLKSFSDNYMQLVNIAQGKQNPELIEKQALIKSIETVLANKYQNTSPPKNDNLVITLNQTKQEVLTLQNEKSLEHQQYAEAVNQAIEICLPEVTNLEIDRSTGLIRILADNFGNRVNITQLSQGQQSLLGLIGDLAIRAIKLNPLAEKPFNCHGIILIDEIELHLHPQWQQQILHNLQSCFPNIQFIVTTHSPQVLSTVDKSCIRQLYIDQKSQPAIKKPTYQTQGVTSASILAQLMETNSIPSHQKQAIWVTEFAQYVAEGQITQANENLTKISKHFGQNHPITMDCIEQLKVYELKKKFLKKSGNC